MMINSAVIIPPPVRAGQGEARRLSVVRGGCEYQFRDTRSADVLAPFFKNPMSS